MMGYDLEFPEMPTMLASNWPAGAPLGGQGEASVIVDQFGWVLKYRRPGVYAREGPKV